MVIEVPAGAYPGGKTFTISYKLITGDPGANINPLTPLITVENGGAFADDVMTVTIPVAIPAGYFAMGFFVDENGKLEGMPLVAETPTSITVATAHFSSFFIAMLADTLLTGTIDTGFRPMTDDWQFANDGSYIEPGGHCTGQALTAMWYYIERSQQGTSTLWNRFDNNGDAPATPDLWQDDSLGYRLASSLILSKVHHALGMDAGQPFGFAIGGAAVSPETVRYFLSLDMKVSISKEDDQKENK
jgi:hypothetical protein